ncbi:TetR/AcrR family transcriptional regulator C-terminal domain-containing protein [Microbacterium aoyamense]|uniref:TetR/AcrR family transcriptional regulator C-terminal domain-containing protein n=1 Tax=Microbacterium aoyamense TaxID=344166 RepID=A0ABP5AZX3_9MICO|nr:TetR/AcrR family transcriptional regulator C-terminal domain-containing protein [Microbacterium aoyamense]
MPGAVKASRREPLTRERVFRAAIELADEEGLEGLTMRRLAERLSVEAMSIYHHVRGKDAVLSGALELVYADVTAEAAAEPAPPTEGWRPLLRQRILVARRILLRHPWAPRALETHGVMTRSLATWVDGNIAAMRSGGLSYDLIHHAMHTLGSRQWGFSQELILADSSDAKVDPEAAAAMAPWMPHVIEMLQDVVHDDPDSIIGWCDDQAEFEFALDVLLDGIEARR